MKSKYTNEDIIKLAKESTSTAELLRKLGSKPSGGNYRHIAIKIKELSVDTSHWTRQLWSKDKQLKDFQSYKKTPSIKKHLLKQRGNTCEECGISEWRGHPVPIEMHHADGDNFNNDISNLILLCANCHRLKPNHNKPKKPSGSTAVKKELKLCSCGNTIKDKRAKVCKKCISKTYGEELDTKTIIDYVPKYGIRETARLINTNHTKVRNYIKKYGLEFDMNCIDCNKKLYTHAIRCKSCEVKNQWKNQKTNGHLKDTN